MERPRFACAYINDIVGVVNSADLIRRARRRAGISQAELASRMGTSQPTIAAYESGARVPSERMLARLLSAMPARPSEILRDRREEVLAAAERHRARNVRVFGSVARGTDRFDSDIDFLVAFTPDASLFDQVGLLAALEAIFGENRVDVVSQGGLLPRDFHILVESIPA